MADKPEESKRPWFKGWEAMISMLLLIAGGGFLFGDRMYIPNDTFYEQLTKMQEKSDQRMESMEETLKKLEITVTRIDAKLEERGKICEPTPPPRTNGRRSR